MPVGDQNAADVLVERKKVWENRPFTREIYRRYFERLSAEFAPGGIHIEIGGGAGMSREFISNTLTSDIVSTPFVDFVADAMHMPLADGSADNLFMVDVLHHLPRPAKFFEEAIRVLRPGGRLVMVEPYISPFSRLVFKLVHPEPVDMSADPFPAGDSPVFSGAGPFASNQAIPRLIFFEHREQFARRFPQLRIVRRMLDSNIAYPLSGGFSGPCLVPRFAWPLAWGLEACSRPLSGLMAFRLIVTLERI